jgi:hypothetical protein
MRFFAIITATLLMPVLVLPQNDRSQQLANLELHLQPGNLGKGIPEAFTFIFANISDHDVRMPEPSYCGSDTTGTIYLELELKPSPTSLVGGGCGGGMGVGGRVPWPPPMRDQAKDWKVLRPGESLTVTFDRKKLFADEQRPGTYEFWAEYTPPDIPAEDQRILTEEGIDFPREKLVSKHLIFVRKPQ